MRKPLPPRPGERPKDDGPRVNDQIRAPRIRLVDQNGEMIGLVSVPEGLKAAEDAGLDLVEISPNADPPVCKILDYGKYKYEMQKKANEARKKQKIIDLKEVKVRPTIEKHDYDVKMRNARRFLEEGDKVKFTMRFRGREIAHQDLGMQVMRRMKDELADIAKPELEPRLEGRQMIMVLVSDKTA